MLASSSAIIGCTSAPRGAFPPRRRHLTAPPELARGPDHGWPDVAQLVEQLIRNRQVGGSSPPVGSNNPLIPGRCSRKLH